MGHVPFTAKPSRELKNSSGQWSELKHSLYFHQSGIPLLVDPALLRERNLGQVDLSKLYQKKGEWFLEILEVKSSALGVEASSRKQSRRLRESADFLAAIFKSMVILKYSYSLE